MAICQYDGYKCTTNSTVAYITAIRKPTFKYSETRVKQKMHLVVKNTVPSVSLSANVDRPMWFQNEGPVAGKCKTSSFSSKSPSEERYRQSK